MASTYEPIATTTLSSTTGTITFTSIPSTYTDLRVIYTGSTTADTSLRATFNNDATSNYSLTRLVGDGASATSNSFTNNNDAIISGQLGTGMCLVALDIFSYAGSTLKTSLSNSSEDKNGSGSVRAAVHLWRSTSAINRLDFFVFGAQFNIGTTVTLYGIKAA